jgi:hypothetical protein
MSSHSAGSKVSREQLRPTDKPDVGVAAAENLEGLSAPGGIRTPDPQIRSLPLSPLSYGRVVSCVV